jgi:TatD DNase family protein
MAEDVLTARKARLMAELMALAGPEERTALLMERARRAPPLAAGERTEGNEVPGCTARLWLACEHTGGVCRFRADSESLVVRAVAMLLCEFYSGAPARAILSMDPAFLRPAGITSHLTANRRAALSRVWERIRGFAERSAAGVEIFDAHNHLHDERFGDRGEDVLAAAVAAGVSAMVVNGSCEEDWPQVHALAERHRRVVPSFGYHPWYVHERSERWASALAEFLDRTPSAVGEIGLDRWKTDLPYEGQEETFVCQLRMAAERNVPASIHCLKAWGRLLDILREEPRPALGFLLHSYGGPAELVAPLAELGAYFSLPGAFAREDKGRKREAFLAVPPDRLLVETDAPDQLPPPGLVTHPLAGGDGAALNHPANLPAVYRFAASLYGESLDDLARRVGANFRRLFGPLLRV